VVIIPLALLALPFGQSGLALFGLLTMLLFYLYCGLVMHRRAADTAAGLALRIGGLVLATIPVLILAVVAQTAVLELVMWIETGASRLDVLYGSMIQASIAAAGR
jgi:hypothetical protein